eukprot:11849963-Prorocentrum_lima.AAC.1
MEPNLRDVSASEMVRKAAWARNMSVTHGAKRQHRWRLVVDHQTFFRQRTWTQANRVWNC